MKDKNFTKSNFVSKQRFIYELIFSLLLLLLALSTCSQNLYAMQEPSKPAFQLTGTSSIYYYIDGELADVTISSGEETAVANTDKLFAVS